MQIILLRHGETEANTKRFYAGRSECPLTATGVAQAEAAGATLASERIETIYASPLRRTAQTAAIVARHTGAPVVFDDGLLEMAMGPWEGLTENQIAQQYPDEWSIWNTRPADLSLPARETLAQLSDRMMDTISRVQARNHAAGILLVTHYALIRVALLRMRGADLNLYKSITVPNCQPIPLWVENE